MITVIFFFQLKYIFSCIDCFRAWEDCVDISSESEETTFALCVALAVIFYTCSPFTYLTDAVKEEAFLCSYQLSSPTRLQRK